MATAPRLDSLVQIAIASALAVGAALVVAGAANF